LSCCPSCFATAGFFSRPFFYFLEERFPPTRNLALSKAFICFVRRRALSVFFFFFGLRLSGSFLVDPIPGLGLSLGVFIRKFMVLRELMFFFLSPVKDM